MDVRTPWQTLVHEALTRLALPVDEQVRVNGPGCVACNLFKGFNHARRMASKEAILSEDQHQTLEAIAHAMQAMTEPDLECFKNEVLSRPAWVRLRELASDALLVFGWEKMVIEPFADVSPGVRSRASRAAPQAVAGGSRAISRSKPALANANETVKPRIPPWVIGVGCLSVFVCLLLCGTAVGVWVYVLKNSNFFGKSPDNGNSSFQSPPNTINIGAAIEDVAVNGRLVEDQGGFSYVPPEGWMAYQLPGRKCRIVSAPIKDGDAPNIFASDELFIGSLEEYMRVNITTVRMTMQMAEFRILKQEAFRTTDGLPGIRVITEVKQGGRSHRQTHYYFGKGVKKYVVVCTTRSERGEELDPIFEASMKTFRLEQE